MSDELRIEVVYEFENASVGPIAYVCRGHIDKAEFVRLLDDERAIDVPIDEVEHAYRRFIPAPWAEAGDGIYPGFWQIEYRPKRGNGPITQWEKWLADVRQAQEAQHVPLD